MQGQIVKPLLGSPVGAGAAHASACVGFRRRGGLLSLRIKGFRILKGSDLMGTSAFEVVMAAEKFTPWARAFSPPWRTAAQGQATDSLGE